ncbi:MAG: MFS transporter [Chloroflexi bacterium]|nr:MFS transporter [Chloroflexota bacterium]
MQQARSSTAPPPMTATGTGRIADSTTFRPFHAWITLLAGLAFMGNGLDLSVVSFALPGMRAELGLSPADVGFVLPMAGIGQLIGSITMGSLADRIGRRLTFVLTGCLAGLGVGLASLAPSALAFGCLLLVAGVGVGGVAPAASALLSELAPPAYRGRMMAWTQVFWVAGWSIAATLGGWFEASLGWRGILAVGGLPIILALICWFVVPESPRFLMASGHPEKAHALAKRLAERHGILVPVVAPHASATRLSVIGQLAIIWGPRFRRRTFALWTTWMAMNAVFSGPVYMLPVVLEGMGAPNPLQLSAYVGYAMIPAGFVSVWAIDRSGRRPLMIVSLALAAFGALGVALGMTPLVVVLGGAALSAGALAAWPVALAWASEQYPTQLRGAAAGWAAGVSRIGSTSAPLIIGQLLTLTGGHTWAILPFSVALFLAVLSVSIFAGETANRTLEELTREK